jgi:hypothetical protein
VIGNGRSLREALTVGPAILVSVAALMFAGVVAFRMWRERRAGR